MNKEKWKRIPIENFNFYQVSNYGRVRRILSKNKFRYLKGSFDTNGYHYVKLSNKGIRNNKSIHRLVALAFIKNPKNKPQVNHIDGNKKNNFYKNLEWSTASEQMIHSYHILKNKPAFGETKKKSSKLKAKDVIAIRKQAGKIRNIDLAKMYNISAGHVSCIIRRKLWDHIK